VCVETGTSAGFQRPLSPVVSEVGLPTRTFPLQLPRPQKEKDTLSTVFEWTQSIEPSEPLPPDQLPPSPALSAWSSSSGSTIVDISDKEYCGDWLVVPTTENALVTTP